MNYDIDGNQSRALFKSLGLENVEGFPPHIIRISMHMDIQSDHQPTVSLERLTFDADGKLEVDNLGNLRSVVERYVLITLADNKVVAEKY